MIPRWVNSISPLARTLVCYRREQFAADLLAGLVVAIMLIPQAMAYAMLAGLPPQAGLYASMVPLMLYSIFGGSNFLSVGPVAMVSLLVLTGVGELATPGSPEFVQLCLTLALLAGLFQIVMAALRLGFLVNFISHPVLNGFTTAAAITIGFSQVKHLLGISVESGNYPFQLIANTLSEIGNTSLPTLAIGLSSCLVLVLFAHRLAPLLIQFGLSKEIASVAARIGPLFAVIVTTCFVAFGQLNQAGGVKIVGEIPSGLPDLTMPELSLVAIRSLIPLAMIVALVGYMESIAVAKALASRRREKVDPNRELFALGIADIGAAFTGGYPVTGGFSRSMVNFSAGVKTPIGSIFTAIIVALSVLFLTPLFFYIPNSVLAAIVVVAVVPLIDFSTPVKLWHYSRSDAIALIVTLVAVLASGIETGILVGIGTTIIMMMGKLSRPHVAEVGRVGNSEHFRNILRHDVQTTSGVFAFRVDESLNFANAPFLQSYIIEQVANRPDIKSVLLISTGINDIDATGLEVLETIHRDLTAGGVGFYMSDVKGPVTDRFQRAGLDELFLKAHIFLSADEAVQELSSIGAPDISLPLTKRSFQGDSLEKQHT